MSDIETSLARIDAALSRLETALESGSRGEAVWGDATPSAPPLKAAHDELEEEVRALRARAVEDAKLRAEAAQAVREALSDLRGAMTTQIENGAPANA